LYIKIKLNVFVVDMATGDKRYTPNFNIDQIDQKLYSILTSKN